MGDLWEYNGTTYNLDPAKMWEARGVLWTYAGRRTADGIPLVTPRAMDQGYLIGPDQPFTDVIDAVGDVREFGLSTGSGG